MKDTTLSGLFAAIGAVYDQKGLVMYLRCWILFVKNNGSQ